MSFQTDLRRVENSGAITREKDREENTWQNRGSSSQRGREKKKETFTGAATEQLNTVKCYKNVHL